jgi:hypothetical protein
MCCNPQGKDEEEEKRNWHVGPVGKVKQKPVSWRYKKMPFGYPVVDEKMHS